MNPRISFGVVCATLSLSVHANVNTDRFEFDRPATGFGTSTTPVGSLAIEQSVPVAYYSNRVNDQAYKVLSVKSHTLVRTGLSSSVEAQVGWSGPEWRRTKIGSTSTERDGTGDVTIGIKKSIKTQDPNYRWSVMASVLLAAGDEGFGEKEDIYRVGSSVRYDLDNRFTTGMNMQYELQDGDVAWMVIPSLEYLINDRWSYLSEYKYRKQESNVTESTVMTGLKWRPKNNVQLDMAVGYGFTKASPRLMGGLGVSALFN